MSKLQFDEASAIHNRKVKTFNYMEDYHMVPGPQTSRANSASTPPSSSSPPQQQLPLFSHFENNHSTTHDSMYSHNFGNNLPCNPQQNTRNQFPPSSFSTTPITWMTSSSPAPRQPSSPHYTINKHITSPPLNSPYNNTNNHQLYLNVLPRSPQYNTNNHENYYNAPPCSPEYNVDRIDDIDNEYYEAQSPQSTHNDDDFKPMIFEKVQDHQVFVRTVPTRKRIYGEEFMEPLILNAQPQAKMIKLEPTEFESFPENSPRKPSTSQSNLSSSSLQPTTIQQPSLLSNPAETIEQQVLFPILPPMLASAPLNQQYNFNENEPRRPLPTCTPRNYIENWLNIENIPKLCSRCYAINCFCHILLSTSLFPDKPKLMSITTNL